MRIVGGNLRGRSLAVPKTNAIRPTTDRTRESLFNIISHNWPEKLDGGRVLDVFAGTGALGVEALSRGADFAMFVENSAQGRALIRENVETFGLTGKTKISKNDATRIGPVRALAPFDLVFADPPYGKKLGESALEGLLEHGWLAGNALAVLEERKDALPASLKGFDFLQRRDFGETAIAFFMPTELAKKRHHAT